MNLDEQIEAFLKLDPDDIEKQNEIDAFLEPTISEDMAELIWLDKVVKDRMSITTKK